MRSDIVPGGIFPDYELPDHTTKLRKLSELQGDDPLILTLARGHYCPKEHQQHLELAAFYPKIAVAYTQIATISTDDHHTLQEFRASVGAQWTFLSDPDRTIQKDLDIQEYTDPMIKRQGEWQECDWQSALEYVSNGLKRIRDDHGVTQIGALATPHSTLEELYLLQKLVRGIGGGNVDHRTRQSDFSADAETQGAPWLGRDIAHRSRLEAAHARPRPAGWGQATGVAGSRRPTRPALCLPGRADGGGHARGARALLGFDS